MEKEAIVFMDTKNKVVDEDYAEKLRETCRKNLGWKVEKGTRIYDDLTEFSKGYSVKKRDVLEVWAIFALAYKLPFSRSAPPRHHTNSMRLALFRQLSKEEQKLEVQKALKEIQKSREWMDKNGTWHETTKEERRVKGGALLWERNTPHDCLQNIESNMTPEHCRICGKDTTPTV